MTAYGAVNLSESAPLWGNQDALAPNTISIFPLTSMEAMNISQGFALFTSVSAPMYTPGGPTDVVMGGVADVAQVFATDSQLLTTQAAGIVYRPESTTLSGVTAFSGSHHYLDVLVENMGHINYGHGMDTDVKGFTDVQLYGFGFTSQWIVYPLQLNYSDGWPTRLPWQPTTTPPMGAMLPHFFRGTLTISGTATPTDTYLATCGWGKGSVWVNGFHLGRYWDVKGPQHTLYVPAALLQPGANEILMFETNFTRAEGAWVAFVSQPDFTGALCAPTVSTTGAEAALDDDSASGGDQLMIDPMRAAQLRRGGGSRSAGAITTVGAWRESRLSPPSLPTPHALKAGATTCAAPTAGLNLTLQPCDIGENAVGWTLIPVKNGVAGGQLSLTASSGQWCMGIFGTNPDTNTPNLSLVACDSRDKSQGFLWFPSHKGVLMSVTQGLFVDVPNSSPTAGTRLELYGNNGGNLNQQWTINATAITTHIATALNGFCVAAC